MDLWFLFLMSVSWTASYIYIRWLIVGCKVVQWKNLSTKPTSRNKRWLSQIHQKLPWRLKKAAGSSLWSMKQSAWSTSELPSMLCQTSDSTLTDATIRYTCGEKRRTISVATDPPTCCHSQDSSQSDRLWKLLLLPSIYYFSMLDLIEWV